MVRRRRHMPEAPSGDGQMTLYITMMMILVSFFTILVAKSNFDETRYSAAAQSIRKAFATLPGGSVAIGVDEGLPYDFKGIDESGRLVLPDLEMARIRAVLAPSVLDQEATIIHTSNSRIISLSAGILFNLDSSQLSPKSEETLLALAQILAGTSSPIRIEGHTNSHPPQTQGVGDNWDISARRAMAVMDFLRGPGDLAPERLSAFAYAGTKPLHSNGTPAGRARNNRVDLVLAVADDKTAEIQGLAEQDRTYHFRGFDFLLKDPRDAQSP